MAIAAHPAAAMRKAIINETVRYNKVALDSCIGLFPEECSVEFNWCTRSEKALPCSSGDAEYWCSVVRDMDGTDYSKMM